MFVKKSTAIASGAVAFLVLAGGATTATAFHKDVTLSLDGQAARAGAFGTTVADVLAANGVVLGERDLVYPSPQDAVSDGDTITVEYSKLVTLNVDGSPRSFYTTSTNLDAALSQVALTDLAGASYSVDRSLALPRTGLAVDVTTPKDVTLVVAGKKTDVATLQLTIGGLLQEQGVVTDSDDRIEPGLDAAVVDGLKVVVDEVEVKSRTRSEVVAFTTTQKNDPSLWKGESTVLTAGQDGRAKRTYRITVVNGEVESRVQTGEKLVRKPVTQVIRVGTKVSANGVGINLARAAMWDRIARCESGNNWHINTGNGYYGGLQFSKASWNSNGGRDFAAYPHQASRAQQITVANRYYAKAGTSPWTCA
jgi:uncharacterized protein YabE (DUF348 family)